MFAIVKNNQFVKFQPLHVPFELDGVNYPANWIVLADAQERQRLGIVEVVYGARPSDKFYTVTQTQPTYNGTVVEVNFTGTAKAVDSVKDQLISEVKNVAYTNLVQSDWMVVAASEKGESIADNWKTWRQSVRTAAADQVTAINACTTVEELEALTPLVLELNPTQAADAQERQAQQEQAEPTV